MALKEGTPVQEFSLPGMFGSQSDTSKIWESYSVKYKKFDLDEVADVLELQNIETVGLKGQDIVVLKKDGFAFMDKYMIVIQYLEKNEV